MYTAVLYAWGHDGNILGKYGGKAGNSTSLTVLWSTQLAGDDNPKYTIHIHVGKKVHELTPQDSIERSDAAKCVKTLKV